MRGISRSSSSWRTTKSSTASSSRWHELTSSFRNVGAIANRLSCSKRIGAGAGGGGGGGGAPRAHSVAAGADVAAGVQRRWPAKCSSVRHCASCSPRISSSRFPG